MTTTLQASDDAPQEHDETPTAEAPVYGEPALDDVTTPEGEELAAQHAAIHQVMDRVVTYRTAAEARDFSPTAAECMALDYHRLLFANADRDARLKHEVAVARLRMLDQFVSRDEVVTAVLDTHTETCDLDEDCSCEVGILPPPFVAFPKIGRLNRNAIITEKIDGTNAQVTITAGGYVFAGSRKRWITPDDDNFGFARWVADHHDELRDGLGVGTHYGEWWGQGIQRGYGLTEKRFSLFNTARWSNPDERPECCGVVPVLGTAGKLSALDKTIEWTLHSLRGEGSKAAPGFMQPEGIVVFHTSTNQLFKVTLENDEVPKALAELGKEN